MIAGDVTCDRAYQRLCTWIDHRDSTGAVVPVLQSIVVPLVVLVALVLLGRIVRHVVDNALREAKGDPQIRTLVHNVLVVLFWVAAMLAALTKAGINIAVLVTFGGVASLAIGLAFQDLLRNVLAGIFLLVERPFRIGDLVTIGDQTGTVETIALRTTALRIPDGRLAVLPNLAAFNGTIVNSSAYNARMFTVTVALPDGADLRQAVGMVAGELAQVDGVTSEPPPAVVPQLTPEATTLECRYWVNHRDHDVDAVALEVAERLHARLSQASIDGVSLGGGAAAEVATPVAAPTVKTAPPTPPEAVGGRLRFPRFG